MEANMANMEEDMEEVDDLGQLNETGERNSMNSYGTGYGRESYGTYGTIDNEDTFERDNFQPMESPDRFGAGQIIRSFSKSRMSRMSRKSHCRKSNRFSQANAIMPRNTLLSLYSLVNGENAVDQKSSDRGMILIPPTVGPDPDEGEHEKEDFIVQPLMNVTWMKSFLKKLRNNDIKKNLVRGIMHYGDVPKFRKGRFDNQFDGSSESDCPPEKSQWDIEPSLTPKTYAVHINDYNITRDGDILKRMVAELEENRKLINTRHERMRKMNWNRVLKKKKNEGMKLSPASCRFSISKKLNPYGQAAAPLDAHRPVLQEIQVGRIALRQQVEYTGWLPHEDNQNRILFGLESVPRGKMRERRPPGALPHLVGRETSIKEEADDVLEKEEMNERNAPPKKNSTDGSRKSKMLLVTSLLAKPKVGAQKPKALLECVSRSSFRASFIGINQKKLTRQSTTAVAKCTLKHDIAAKNMKSRRLTHNAFSDSASISSSSKNKGRQGALTQIIPKAQNQRKTYTAIGEAKKEDGQDEARDSPVQRIPQSLLRLRTSIIGPDGMFTPGMDDALSDRESTDESEWSSALTDSDDDDDSSISSDGDDQNSSVSAVDSMKWGSEPSAGSDPYLTKRRKKRRKKRYEITCIIICKSRICSSYAFYSNGIRWEYSIITWRRRFWK